MKKLILILLFSIFAIMANSWQLYAQLPPINKNFKMVFQDEFDSLGVDSINKWSRNDWHSQWWRYTYDSQCYTFLDHRTNSLHNLSFDTTGTGKITLIAKKENTPLYYSVTDGCVTPDTSGLHPFSYTTPAMFESYRKFKYGYFEIRCKIPYIDTANYTIRGIGPNFWLYRGIAGGTPYWSEIDVFEFYNKKIINPPTTYKSPFFASCSHFQRCENTDICPHWGASSTKYLNNTGNYHKYAAWWSPDKIEYYYDDQLFYTTIQKQDSMAAQAIILDINIFSNDTALSPVPSSLFPFNYDIDYVKVYQLNQRCSTDTSFCSFNPSTFNFSLYKTITFGDGSCNLTINSGSPLIFLSTDGFTLNPGTEITSGTEVTFDFDDCQPDPGEKSSEQSLPVLMHRETVKGH